MENVRNSEISDLLRPYQWKGVHFLLRQNTCLLADEMGLGKTVQVGNAEQSDGLWNSRLVPKTANIKIDDQWLPRIDSIEWLDVLPNSPHFIM